MLGFRAWTVKVPTNRRRVTRVYTTGKNLSLSPEVVSEEQFIHTDRISLGAIAHSKSWPDNFMQAECMSPAKRMTHTISPDGILESAPAVKCGCGIYAFYDWDFAKRELAGHEVIGVVQGWGKLQLHETGFRSEFMSIIGFVDFWEFSLDFRYTQNLVHLSKRYHAPIMGVKEAKALQLEFSSDWKTRIFNVENPEDYKEVQ